MELATGERYEGQINSTGMRQGKGRVFYPNGSFYEGYWNEDLFQGRGRYIDLVEDSVYEGSFNKGTKEGHGILTDRDGDIYNGEWHNDLKHG